MSTWPCTKWPPIRDEAERARSRLTGEETRRELRFVRRRVSGERPTLNVSGAEGVVLVESLVESSVELL